MTTTTIDCDTCPVRGRHCGDCFVPVLARVWLDGPEPLDQVRAAPREDAERQDAEELLLGLPLDTDELAAVSAFVRAGLVHPDEADRARALADGSRRSAVG